MIPEVRRPVCTKQSCPFSAARKMNALHRCDEDNAIGVSTRHSYPHRMFELAMHGLARSDIARVHEIIAPYIRQTPLLHASGSDVGLGPFRLTLKLESTQHAGSFK